MEKIQLKAPDGAVSLSVDGSVYDVIKGKVEVLSEHVDQALSHGFAVMESRAEGKAD